MQIRRAFVSGKLENHRTTVVFTQKTPPDSNTYVTQHANKLQIIYMCVPMLAHNINARVRTSAYILESNFERLIVGVC